MGTVGTGLWGAGSSSGGATVGVPLSALAQAMLRIAGITTLPGTTPSVDQYGEIPGMVNRMIGSWNLDGNKIFTASINVFSLVADQKIYTIGPGGDFDMARPLFIKSANCLFPTSPVVRQPVYIMDDDEWADISIQDITGAPVWQLYYDGGYDENGRGSVYVRFQPPEGYSLELYTWTALQTGFTSVDDIAIFPPGYEEAIVQNGARKLVGLYPLDSKLTPVQRQELREMANSALSALMTLNTSAPRIGTEPGLSRDDGADGYRKWLTGNLV